MVISFSYTHINTHTHIHIYAYTYIYTQTQTCTHTHTDKHAHTNTCNIHTHTFGIVQVVMPRDNGTRNNTRLIDFEKNEYMEELTNKLGMCPSKVKLPVMSFHLLNVIDHPLHIAGAECEALLLACVDGRSNSMMDEFLPSSNQFYMVVPTDSGLFIHT